MYWTEMKWIFEIYGNKIGGARKSPGYQILIRIPYQKDNAVSS